MSTIVICVVLSVIVIGIFMSMIKSRKNGKCSCGNDCGCCPMGGNCHGKMNDDIK
ncbi:MAG: FeoB-associated Cys-rich membrane protein [Ruminiclostridium sp.]|nr:FeoB-associated Cys-rich membrane protein [Ruminiclostridium sp.]